MDIRLERRSLMFHDLAIVNSRAGVDLMRRSATSENIVHIPNGIDTRRFRPDAQRRESVRAGWGLSADIRAIGAIGRLDPVKDYETLLRACALLFADTARVCLVCVAAGSNAYLMQLKALTHVLRIEKQVIWLGPMNDVSAVYNGFDIFCLSSAYGEGFPNVIGEAMSSGVPCVATDTGDSKYVIDATGWVVPPAAPESLATALRLALESAGEERRRMCRRRLEVSFSREKMVVSAETAMIERLRSSRGVLIG
jgi:glycosyltransferase involved in cell wall biosynthesis